MVGGRGGGVGCNVTDYTNPNPSSRVIIIIMIIIASEREETGETLALVPPVADELDHGAVRRWRHDDVSGRQVPAVARYDWWRQLVDAVAH